MLRYILAGMGTTFLIYYFTRPVAAMTSEEKRAGVENMTRDQLYQFYGFRYSVEPELIKAIAQVESGENFDAVNPYDPSYGIMQVLFTGSNHFNIDGWQEVKAKGVDFLMQPHVNIKMGSQILAWNVKTYGKWKGVAVYNRWKSRNESEPFTNQSYVNKVKRNYENIMLRGLN